MEVRAKMGECRIKLVFIIIQTTIYLNILSAMLTRATKTYQYEWINDFWIVTNEVSCLLVVIQTKFEHHSEINSFPQKIIMGSSN